MLANAHLIMSFLNNKLANNDAVPSGLLSFRLSREPPEEKIVEAIEVVRLSVSSTFKLIVKTNP